MDKWELILLDVQEQMHQACYHLHRDHIQDEGDCYSYTITVTVGKEEIDQAMEEA